MCKRRSPVATGHVRVFWRVLGLQHYAQRVAHHRHGEAAVSRYRLALVQASGYRVRAVAQADATTQRLKAVRVCLIIFTFLLSNDGGIR